MTMIIIDFETRGTADLIGGGSDNYVTDPTTDILCMAAYDMATAQTWLWYPPMPLPEDLTTAIAATKHIAAHNARFDQGVWECIAVPDYGFPTIPADKWYCTAAQCRVNAVPGGLDMAAKFVTGKRLKMAEGKALIKLLSIPNADGGFTHDPDALTRMGDYCLQDVIATAEVVRHTRCMTIKEHGEWQASERINDRGVKIDRELAELAVPYAAHETAEIADELAEISDGAVTAVTQIQRIKKWVVNNVGADVVAKYLSKTVEKDGVDVVKTTFDKGARAALSHAVKSGAVTIPPEVYTMLELTEAGNMASVAKFKRMLTMADPTDDRVRGAYIYAGASQTKRYSAKGLQVHNFRRDTLTDEQVAEAKPLMRQNALHMLDPDVSAMDTLSRMLRPALIPADGNTFVVADWAAIEGRVLPWLANDSGARRVLEVFRSGADIYAHTAKTMGLSSRQIGKVATLALGYQGGVNAFNTMGRAYGVTLTDDAAQTVVVKWREANQWAVNFWDGLERAAKRAIKREGAWQQYGRVRYCYAKNMLGGTLICALPDDSVIQYPQARIETVQTSWGAAQSSITFAKAATQPAAGDVEWPRTALYGGLLAENVTQAVAAALLRNALTECEKQGLHVVLHVHDEIVAEAPEASASEQAQKLSAIMEVSPAWASDLPLSAPATIKTRYGK